MSIGLPILPLSSSAFVWFHYTCILQDLQSESFLSWERVCVLLFLLIFLINHAACLWCCLLMSQHKKCIKLLEHSVIMLILPADWEIYTRIHNMLCNLWFTQNTRASWCWTFGRKPSRLKSTLWYSPYLSSIFNFIMELQLSFSDINIQNDSHLQFHEVMKYMYLSTRNCTVLILLEN